MYFLCDRTNSVQGRGERQGRLGWGTACSGAAKPYSVALDADDPER